MFVSDVSDFEFVGKVKPAFLLQTRKYNIVCSATDCSGGFKQLEGKKICKIVTFAHVYFQFVLYIVIQHFSSSVFVPVQRTIVFAY